MVAEERHAIKGHLFAIHASAQARATRSRESVKGSTNKKQEETQQ
jgi:hypothetical protein